MNIFDPPKHQILEYEPVEQDSKKNITVLSEYVAQTRKIHDSIVLLFGGTIIPTMSPKIDYTLSFTTSIPAAKMEIVTSVILRPKSFRSTLKLDTTVKGNAWFIIYDKQNIEPPDVGQIKNTIKSLLNTWIPIVRIFEHIGSWTHSIGVRKVESGGYNMQVESRKLLYNERNIDITSNGDNFNVKTGTINTEKPVELEFIQLESHIRNYLNPLSFRSRYESLHIRTVALIEEMKRGINS